MSLFTNEYFTKYSLFFYLGIFIFVTNAIIYGIGIDISYFGILLIYIGWRKPELYSWVLWILWIFIIIDMFAIFYKIKVLVIETVPVPYNHEKDTIEESMSDKKKKELDSNPQSEENDERDERDERDENDERENMEEKEIEAFTSMSTYENPFHKPIDFTENDFQSYTNLHELFSPNFVTNYIEPLTNNNKSETSNTKKIAFCFLIYDKINHEHLWKQFFDNADTNKYNIYIHYKENKPLEYFEDKKLNISIPTHWGHKSLVKASNYLLTTAYEDDPDNYKFILVSNSCIPLKHFNDIYNKLTADNMGYVNESNTVNFEYTKTVLYNKIKDSFSKSSQWMIMNREILEKIAMVPESDIDEYCTDIYAPDEIYYLSMIKYHGLYNQVIATPNTHSTATTFTFWNGMPNYPFAHIQNDKANPHNYKFIESNELDYLLKEPCLFGRKFAPGCVVVNSSLNKETKLVEYMENKIYSLT